MLYILNSKELFEITNYLIRALQIVIACFLSLCFASPTKTLALTSSGHYLGASFYNQNLNKITNSPNGETSLFGNFVELPLFSWKGYFSIASNTTIAPFIGYTLLPRTSKDGAAEITLLMVSAPIISPINENWEWSYGLTYIRQGIEGKGGTVVLNNGTGTATFYRPTGSSSSSFFSADIGIQRSLFTNYQFSLDLKTVGLLSDRRAFNLLLSLHYKFNSGSAL